MKKISIVLVAIMTFSLMFGASARPEIKKNYSADALEDAEIVMFIPAGEKYDAVGYLDSEENNAGPESFAVRNGNVYVLDSVKNRIIAKEADNTRFIPISGINHPDHLALAGDRICVIDENSIKVISLYGNSISEMSLPSNIKAIDIFRLYGSSNELYLLTHDLECYKTDLLSFKWEMAYNIEVEGCFEQVETLLLSGSKVDIKVGSTSLVQYLQHTENEIVVGVYEFVPYLPVIETEYTVRKYDMQGQLKGCTVINNLEAYSIPNTIVSVDPYTGDVYTMLCREDGVYITKPNFRMEYRSHMDELTEIAEKIVGSNGKDFPMRYSTVTSKTRAQVKNRAEAARDHVWTVTARNKQSGTHITVPQYVLDTDNNDTVTGIPYCWGGYFLDFETADDDGFDDIIADSTGGNTYHYLGHGQVPGTAGLDCSGFVSYAYHVSRYNTEGLTGFGHYIYGNQSNSTLPTCSFGSIKYMDFLVRYSDNATNNHVMLLYAKMSDTSIKTIESTTAQASTGIEGVKHRNLSIDDLSGYRLRTPYACGGTGSCSYGSDYHTSSTKHWHVCIHCGEAGTKSDHTWSAYQHDSTNHWKECTVCGRVKSQAAHTWGAYNYDSAIHWKECSVCGRVKNSDAHTLSSYLYNDLYHWKECSVCNYSTAKTAHNWVSCNAGFRCSDCLMLVTNIPQPTGIIGRNACK